MDKNPIFLQYYNPQILLEKEVILDVLTELIGKNLKVLVFGLGRDSNLWYNSNGKKNIWFVE